MNTKKIIDYLLTLEGNYIVPQSHLKLKSASLHQRTSFSPANVMRIVDFTKPTRSIPDDILITPLIILPQTSGTYELLGYETSIETIQAKSFTVEYNEKNALPPEVLESIHPKIFLNLNEYDAFEDYLLNYLAAMKNMTFSDNSTVLGLLARGAKLYYEVI